MDADAAGPAGRRAASLLGVAIALDAGHHRHQVVPVAVRQRQLLHLVVVDHGAEHRGFGAEQRRDAGDRDRFADRPDRQRDVEARARSNLHRYGLLEALESGGLRLHQVLTRQHVQHQIDAVVVGLHFRDNAGGQAGDGHLRFRDDGVGRILDDAGQRGAVDLRRSRRDVQQKHGDQGEHAVQSPFHSAPPDKLGDLLMARLKRSARLLRREGTERCLPRDQRARCVPAAARAAGGDPAAAIRGGTWRAVDRRWPPSTGACPQARSDSRHRTRGL